MERLEAHVELNLSYIRRYAKRACVERLEVKIEHPATRTWTGILGRRHRASSASLLALLFARLFFCLTWLRLGRI